MRIQFSPLPFAFLNQNTFQFFLCKECPGSGPSQIVRHYSRHWYVKLKIMKAVSADAGKFCKSGLLIVCFFPQEVSVCSNEESETVRYDIDHSSRPDWQTFVKGSFELALHVRARWCDKLQLYLPISTEVDEVECSTR